LTTRHDERSEYLMCHHHVYEQVTVDSNMFRLLMKNRIIDNIHNHLIVTIHQP